MLKLFILLKSHTYARSLALQLMLLRSHRERNSPIWTMMVEHLGSWVEENGEKSFSLLSHAVLSDTMSNHIEHMNKLYTLLSVYREALDDIRLDGQTWKTKRSENVIKPDHPIVANTVTYVNSMIDLGFRPQIRELLQPVVVHQMNCVVQIKGHLII